MKKKLSLAILLLSVAVNAQELIKRTFITPSLPPVETKSSQTLLWDQNPGTIPPPDLELISIPITHSNVDDKALWYADDFKLSSASEITKIKIFGITYDPNDFINNNLTGVDLYIYANSNDNIPSSNPSEVGTGLLEIINLDSASSALEIEDDNGLGTGVVNFTFDIEEHNGSSFHLPEGTYWISFFPRLDNLSYVDFGDEEALKVWTTMGPDPDITNTLSHGQVMDKDMVLTDNYTTWTSVLEASDNEVENFAFTIEGNPLLSVDEFEEDSLSIYPNPTNGPLTIDNPSDDGSIVTHYTVFDINGRKISTGKETGMFTLDMEALSAGPYFLQLDLPDRSLTTKIIKQHP